MGIIVFNGPDDWHRLRAQNVGASDIAALFGYSPWTTEWKLYMEKSGQLPPGDEKKWMTRGRHFEPAIASYAREVFELDVVKVEHYWTDDHCAGLGASLDYTLQGDLGVPVEIKWVENYEGWDWSGDELTTIPDYYLFQVQHQMACTGAPYGILIAFIAGAVKKMVIPRSDAIIGALRMRVTKFWEDITKKLEPKVDFLKDADTIFDIAKHRPLRTIELPAIAHALFETVIAEKAIAKAADEKVTAAEAELLKMVLDAGIGNDGMAVAACGDYTMKLTKVADNPGKIVTGDMVGSVIGVRKGYLRTTIAKKKEK